MTIKTPETMRTTVTMRPPAAADGLAFPFEKPPDFGRSLEVADGLHWLRMPLGGSLAAINVWAIEDGDGWVIVDTGLGNTHTIEAWRGALKGPLGGRPITRVFVTHLHPDHIGAAGWLTRTFECDLWISRLEFLMCRSLAADTGRPPAPDGIRFYHEAGWTQEQLGDYRARFGGFGRMLHALPDSFVRLTDGQELEIGGRAWRVVMGSGHSPEHACLACDELGVFISGDQVLPRITSNVSVFPTEPLADPLSDWLASLRRLKTVVSNDVLVLPAHNAPFFGLHPRIDAIVEHHEASLERLRGVLSVPRRAVDVFPTLFSRPISDATIGMATGESIAHLNHLVARKFATSQTDAGGVRWYRELPTERLDGAT
jgi:glyoxylase-like metal-dependent hydrolase (beta-lactamase superfamily II)